MNRNLNRRIHPIAEADGLSPKKLVIWLILQKRAAARAYGPTAAMNLSATPYGIMRHTDQLSINLIT